MSDDWRRSVAVGDRALWVPPSATPAPTNGHAPISEEPVQPSAPVSADRPADTDRPNGQESEGGRRRANWSVVLGALATAIVAVGSAVLSWDALSWGAGQIGVDSHLTWLFPVVLDGNIAVGTVAAVALRGARRRVRAYVWGLLSGAIAASVVGNAAHAAGGSVVHVIGAAVPAVALAASLHLLVLLVRHASGTEAGDAPGHGPVPRPSPHADDALGADGFRTRGPRRFRTGRRRPGPLGRGRFPHRGAEADPQPEPEPTAETSADDSAEADVAERGTVPQSKRGNRPQSVRASGPRMDPKLLRIARGNGTWRDVRKAFPEISDDAAQRKLAAARKELRNGSAGSRASDAEAGAEGGTA